MILYFTDRQFNVIGQASTSLPLGLIAKKDNKIEDVESGVATFECEICFDEDTRKEAERLTECGNYLLCRDDENKFYTIIDSEIDTDAQTAYIYAEDAGLDLLNDVVGKYEADKEYPIEHYINMCASHAGFVININEAEGIQKKLKFDEEETATKRIAEIATLFDGCEISFSFEIDGLNILNKHINVFKKRGQDNGETLYLNRDIDYIITSKSISNLATALRCTGGTPEDAEEAITLLGFSYDDGDFYIDGDTLKSRNAFAKWNRFFWKTEQTEQSGGHITKTFSSEAMTQAELLTESIAELKKLCDVEVNYKVEIPELPKGIKIGDRINIVDRNGELYLSTRLLQLETSITDQKCKATFGEHLIKSNGIHQKVADLAAQFAKNSASAARALKIAAGAQTTAEQAQAQANAALTDAENAQAVANEAKTAANAATESAEQAQTAASNAQSAVDVVEKSVESLETTVTNAQNAANQAQQAAETAETKATEAQQAAQNAQAKAEEAKTAASTAQSTADSANTKADAAQNDASEAKTQAAGASATAAAAKADAEQAQKDIDAFGENLTTLENTMKADYARKTDLTESEAHLQSQISQNAAQITQTVSRVETIDETANNAQEQAQAAQNAASAAQTKADEATAEAQAAQTAADEAKSAANAAQSEADIAKAAAATAQSVADKAEADLEAAKADLATVSSRVDATQEEIEAAQNAVNAAQSAAEQAQANAQAATEKANTAQNTANEAATNAVNAQTAANDAASAASLAQRTADEAKGDASAAQTKANEAAEAAAEAQRTANTAVTNATNAQTKANEAAAQATAAQQAADDADAKAAQAQTDLNTAKQNLANVTSRVDATEEEVAAAQAAVETAQAAADKAKADATAAQATADTAKANAQAAQTVADNAKIAAEGAQKAAEDAQAAADKAQADVDALEVRTTTAETKIEQNSEAILQRATKTELTQAIGAIEIGGRNIITNSKNMQSYLNGSDTGATRTCTTEGDITYITFDMSTRAEGKNYDNAYLWLTFSEEKKQGETYTLSFDYRSQTDAQLYFYPNQDDQKFTTWALPSSAGEWVRFSRTYEHTGTSTSGTSLFGCHHPSDNTLPIDIRLPKLEKGNKATDWTPAPEDMATGEDLEENITAVHETLLEQSAEMRTAFDEILLSALRNYVETNGEDYSALKEAVASLQVQADGITAKVEKTEADIKSVDDDLQEKFNQISLIFSITVDGVTIGRTESPYKLFLDDNEFSMQVNGARVLWFEVNENAKSANIPELNVTEKFTLFGLEGKKDSFGNINFVPIGG